VTALHRLLAPALAAACLAIPAPGWAGSTGSQELGAVVIDADSGAVLHAVNANRRVLPASLTKLMTVWLLLETLHSGRVDEDDPWAVSTLAAGQPATRLGLRSGSSITAGTVVDALLVASANDAALVAAEALAGSEAAFVRQMNDAAARLGLGRTRFANASGLPARAQHTTARDMAVLARRLWQRFPAQRSRFTSKGMTHAGRWIGNHNGLLGSYRGARGMKTGFTCAAGFNVVAAAERGGRTLIAVVLGAPTRQDRDRLAAALLDRGFAAREPIAPGLDVDTLADASGQGADEPVHLAVVARSCLVPAGPRRWNIDLGARVSAKEARAFARAFIREHRETLRGARAITLPRYIGVELHRAIVTGVGEKRAREACLAYRSQDGAYCVIFGPQAAARQARDAARMRALSAAGAASARAPGAGS